MTILYVGQTRAYELMAELTRLGIRELTQRDDMPPKRLPYAIDNGCYADAVAKPPRAWNEAEFIEGIDWARDVGSQLPDFVVVPDIVAGGQRSYLFSRAWYLTHAHRYPGFPWYFAVQDGMTPETLDLSWGDFAGIFVGGSLDWKLKTAQRWCQWAHDRGLKLHIGRAATAQRIRWARRIGADSVDGNGPLWSQEALALAVSALYDPLPWELF